MSDEMNNAGTTPATQPTSGTQDAPLLIFGDAAGNTINEITLAPGEQKKIKVILSNQPGAITQNFQAQWVVYDSKRQPSDIITCVVDPDTKKWLTPLCLSTSDDAVGGMEGNNLISAKVDNGIWRCIGKNPNEQFWYPRDLFTTPVPVAEFTLMAASDWTDECATLELDNNFTKFTLTADTTVPAASNLTTPCNYSMALTIKNAKAGNVTPPQDNDGEAAPQTQENDVSNTQVQLDILMKAWTLSQQKNVEVQFIYNTCRYEKDANGNTIKVSGRKRVNDVKLYSYSESHDIRYLSLEEGEYVDGKVILRVNSRISEAHTLQTHITALIDASTGKIGLIIIGSSDRNQTLHLDQASSAKLSDVKYLPISVSQDNSEATTPPQNNGEHMNKEDENSKEKEEQENKEKAEQRRKDEINEFINRCPVFSVEDGYATPPKIHQNANDAGVWVRGFRESKKGTWFMIDDNVNNQYIYPGNIILVDRDKKFTQNMVQIPFEASERKPLRLDARYSSEMPNGSTTLNSFTRADVNNFVSQCLTNFKKSEHDLASNTNWQYESSKRTEGITLGGTIEGIKFSGSAFQSNKTVAVAYLRQEMYTISVNNEYSYASDLFTDKVDTEKFRRNIKINSNDVAAPAIIDAVKYGRIISLWVVQEGNEPASLNVDDYFNVTVNHTNKSTKYHLHVFGGIAGTQSTETDSLENVQNVLKQFKEVNKTAMETAMPIEYSVRFLSNLTTNVEWKVLPYYKTYLPRIKFRVTENNKGASMKCAVYMLNYEMVGNQYKYVKTEVDKKGVDYECYPSPKALCIDIKIDVTSGLDRHDFNVMLPCIPYDRLEPNEKGEWEFKVNISGYTIGDKQAECIPSLPGAILSTSNQIYMNNPKILDGPLIRFGKGTDNYTEDKILNYYIAWAKGMVSHNKNLRFLYEIDNINQLRPDYD